MTLRQILKATVEAGSGVDAAAFTGGRALQREELEGKNKCACKECKGCEDCKERRKRKRRKRKSAKGTESPGGETGLLSTTLKAVWLRRADDEGRRRSG